MLFSMSSRCMKLIMLSYMLSVKLLCEVKTLEVNLIQF